MILKIRIKSAQLAFLRAFLESEVNKVKAPEGFDFVVISYPKGLGITRFSELSMISFLREPKAGEERGSFVDIALQVMEHALITPAGNGGDIFAGAYSYAFSCLPILSLFGALGRFPLEGTTLQQTEFSQNFV